MAELSAKGRRDLRWMFLSIGVAVAGALLFAFFATTISPTPGTTGSGPWTARNVSLPLSSPGGEPRYCFFVNSTANTDLFCLALIPGAAGFILNGTFDHGPGTLSALVQLAEGPPCFSNCRTSATWTSPDGTGQVYWTFTTNVTLEALD